MSQILNLATCPLEGIHLIEASAGTGKTYTLVNLCLRLLTEKSYRIQQLGVVTFTEAATQELQGRLRLRLRQALQALQTGPGQDPFLRTWLPRVQDMAGLSDMLRQALHDLELAQIATIHAFCQWALGRFPLRSGQAFQIAIRSDQRPLLAQAVQDFWRHSLYANDQAWVILEAGWNPDCLQSTLLPWLGLPELRLLPKPQMEPALLRDSLRRARQSFEEAYAAARALWQAGQTEILEQAASLGGSKTFQTRYLNSRVKALQNYFQPRHPRLPAEGDKLVYFSAGLIASKHQGTAPTHPFFAAVQQLLNSAEALAPLLQETRLHWQHQLSAAVRQHLRQSKLSRQELAFEDLLIQLQQALRHPVQGPELARELRGILPVVLIDEFQDTDRLQYEIFSQIYPAGPLFLIGDPKQSIYAFRGADINSYLRVRQQLPRQQRHTLGTNFRTRPALLKALEQLFTHSPEPFAHPEITFTSVAAGKQDTEWLAPPDDAALEIAWLPAEDKPLSKEKAWQELPDKMATVIAGMLASNAWQLKEAGRLRPLQARDVAILVRTHLQGQAVRDALQKLRVPCVLYAQESVFQTVEAEALLALLELLAGAIRPERVLPVLVGPLFALSLSQLQALQQERAGWEPWLDSFQQAQQVWEEQGFTRMWTGLVQRHQMYAGLLHRAGSERGVTNLRQLTELLQNFERQQQPSRRQLLAWFRQETQLGRTDQENLLLQLETERDAVQILTIHRSKGLEFPVVFCPTLWDGRSVAAQPPLLSAAHDSEGAILDLGSEQLAQRAAQTAQQNLEEDLRLTYVALTRARYKLWVAWGAVNQIEQTALGYWFQERHPQELKAALQAAVAKSAGTWALRSLADIPAGRPLLFSPAVSEPPPMIAPPAWPRIALPLSISSFSGLLTHQAETRMPTTAGTPPISPRQTPETAELAAEGPLMSLPTGSRTGRLFHRLLEHIAPQTPPEQLGGRLLPFLQRAGLEPALWLDPLSQGLPMIWQTPLFAGGFCLAELSAQDRFAESSFYFTLQQSLSPERLRNILVQGGSPWAEHLPQTGILRPGLFTGRMDLIARWRGRYYVLDYKSNGLGLRWADYQGAALEQVLTDRLYILQLYFYQVALHRLLRLRLPDYQPAQHLGGGILLFLRGMRPEPAGSGVYFEPAAPVLIQALSEALGEKPEQSLGAK